MNGPSHERVSMAAAMAADDRRAQAFYFGGPSSPIFGQLHPARGAAAAGDLGVVVCPSVGVEETNAHKTLRSVAQRLADAGVPVLRFDLPGTGDSTLDEQPTDLVERWQASIDAACDTLRAHAGVRRIALLGHRLGALLALRAAAARADVDAVVALVPVAGGRVFVRELSLLAKLGSAAGAGANAGAAGTGGAGTAGASRSVGGNDGARGGPPSGRVGSAGSAGPAGTPGIESGGFVFSAATCDALRKLELRASLPRAGVPVLVLDRGDRPSAGPLVDMLRTAGVAVESREVPDYAGMMLDPDLHEPAPQVEAAICEWLVKRAAATRGDSAGDRVPDVAVSGWAAFGAVHECLTTLDPDGVALSAVATLPCAPSGSAIETARSVGRVVVLVNAGATRRIGPGGLYVKLARRLAADGWLVVRLDLSGLGDTPPRAGAAAGVVYSPTAVDELGAAMRWLRHAWQVRDLRVVGVCSGAYHAFRLALAGGDVDAVYPVNPLTFDWDADRDNPMPAYKVVSLLGTVRASGLRPDRLKSLVRGEVDLQRVAAAIGARIVGATAGSLREAARVLRLPLKMDLAQQLRTVLEAHVGLAFVFSAGDPGLELLRRQGGVATRRLLSRGTIGLRMVPDATHTFESAHSKERLADLLSELLAQPAARNGR